MRISTRSFIVTLIGFVIAAALSVSAVAQENMLRYGEPVEGGLASGETATYTFEGQTGDRPIIIANAKGGEIDPVASLYDPNGQLIGQDDNGNGKYNARLEGIVLSVDGTYTVEVLNNAPGLGGNYALIVNEASQVIFYHSGATEEGEIDPGSLGPQAYELSRPWPTTEITFSLLNTLGNFNEAEVREVITAAFQAWANDSPLTFTEVNDPNAHIIISFDRIDGSSNVLGQACPPSSPCAGEVIFDMDESWILWEPEFYDEISLLGVATHEFGHAIGLLHSSDASALMYAQYSPYNLQPSRDDISGLQRLYGAGSGGVISPTSVPGVPQPADPDTSQVQGRIDDNQFTQLWDFDVQAGEDVTITMSSLSGGLDPLLIIIDANDNVLAFDDDSAGDLDARVRNISFPQTGTYTVAATRFEQAQGYTEGDYLLSITYGTVPEDQPAQPGPTTVPSGEPGSVQVSRVTSAALQEYPLLDTILEGDFIDSTSPLTQSSTGTVQGNSGYIWSTAWCAVDEATLNTNLESIEVLLSVDGQPVDARTLTQAISNEGDLSCALNFALLTNWQPGQVNLSATLRLQAPVFDGFKVYSAGDYVYNYTINVR